MVKPAQKKRKTSKKRANEPRLPPAPLGSLNDLADEEGKDDEERRLESLLFGTPFVPAVKKNDKHVLIVADDDDDDERDGDDDILDGPNGDDAGRELENMLDQDLFFFDTGAPEPSHSDAEQPVVGIAEQEAEASDSVASEPAEQPASSSEDEGEAKTAPPTQPTRTRAAWADPDDTTLNVSLAASNRLRKLRDAPSEDIVGGREYERRLRRQYEKINPTPDWAVTARKKTRPKRPRSSSGSEGSDESDHGDSVQELFKSTNGITRVHKKGTLPQGTLAIERLRDANQAAASEGEVKVVRFHPSPQVPVLLTAGADRRARLFNIDGLTNPHLQTLHIPSLPITNASFHPSGSTILFTGPRPFYYTYNLQSGTTHRCPRGLWGTTFNNANPSAQDSSMETCAFSPSGDILAVAGRRGYVHLVDWRAGGAQVVGSVKMNTGVKDVWWARGNGEAEGRTLMSLGEDSMVYVWDVGQRQCVRRWQDDGGFGSRRIGGDSAGKYVAIGSNTGLVNVYGADASCPSGNKSPKPLKTIGNLTTSISTLRFNHDSQLLAIASKDKRESLRMIHLPSLTAFANWPTSSTPLGHVTAVDFSPTSEYCVIGNHRGRVLLYHLREFGAS